MMLPGFPHICARNCDVAVYDHLIIMYRAPITGPPYDLLGFVEPPFRYWIGNATNAFSYHGTTSTTPPLYMECTRFQEYDQPYTGNIYGNYHAYYAGDYYGPLYWIATNWATLNPRPEAKRILLWHVSRPIPEPAEVDDADNLRYSLATIRNALDKADVILLLVVGPYLETDDGIVLPANAPHYEQEVMPAALLDQLENFADCLLLWPEWIPDPYRDTYRCSWGHRFRGTFLSQLAAVLGR